MKAKRFNLATILCALFSAAFLSVGIVFTVPAKAADVTGEQAQSIFVMDEGASVRIGEEGTADVNGLKFTASMTDANYQDLMADVGEEKTYSKATFGMLIAPASYEGLNYANVFGQEAIYGWSLFDEETGEWLPYEGEKTEIINIYNQKLYQVVDAESGVISWEFRGGSITNLVGEWIATDFQGLAYVELTKNDGTGCDYTMANAGQIANMYEVAVKSYYDENSELTADDKAWIKANYIEAASEAVATDIGLTPATSIDLAEYGLPEGEYDFYVQQYINKANNTEKYTGGNGKEYTRVTSELTKDFVGEKAVATVDGMVVDTSSLEGMYAITAAFSGTDYGYTFYVDRYTPGTFVWNNVADINESARLSDTWGSSSWEGRSALLEYTRVEDNEADPVTAGRTGTYYKVQFSSYYDVMNDENIDGFGVKIFPVHSREYYATLFAGKSIKMDYYYSKDVSAEGSADIYWQFTRGYGMGNGESDLDFAQPYNSWEGRGTDWLSRQSLAIDTITDESIWISVVSTPRSADSGKGTLIGLRNAVNNGIAINPDTGAADYAARKETSTSPFTFYFGNVHLSNENITYIEKAVDLEGNEIATYEKTAPLGSTVTFSAPEVAGYVYVPSNPNNVLNAFITGTRQQTLVGYYAPAIEETIDGIIKYDNINLKEKLGSDVVSYTVTQYICRGSSMVGIDVTNDYLNRVNAEGIIDISDFDGIYTIEALAENGSAYKGTFERMIDGVFTWNNIKDVAALSVGYGGIWAGNTNGPAKAAVLVDESTDPLIAGRDGVYYAVSTNYAEIKDKFGIKIYPAHSKEYFQKFYDENNAVSIMWDFAFTRTEDTAGEYTSSWNFMNGYGIGGSTSTSSQVVYANLWTSSGGMNTWNGRWALDLATIINGWDSLVKVNSGAAMITPRNFSDSYTGEVKIYIGNVHLYSEIKYTNEYYLWDDVQNDYVLDESVSEQPTAKLGSTVEFNAKAIDGYAFDSNNINNVLSAMVLPKNETVLKGYYVKAKTVEYADIISDETIDFEIGAISSYTVTQYYYKGSDKIPVDVTDKYPELFDENGVLQAYKLDGVFDIQAVGETGAAVYRFERFTPGTFVFNNLDQTDDATASSLGLKGMWGSDAYVGSAVTTMVYAEDVPVLSNAGKTGIWWKAGVGKKTEGAVTLRAYPTHSPEYFNMYAGVTVQFSYYVHEHSGSKSNFRANYGPYINGAIGDYKWPNTNTMYDATFSITTSTFNYATVQSGKLGAIFSVNSGSYMKTDTYDVYVSSAFIISSAPDLSYTNEYYLYDSASGEYLLDEELTETATAQQGSLATFNEKVVDGYLLDKSNVNSVLSAPIFADGSVVLKGYYIPAITETIEGLRSEATLDLGIGEVSEYTLTQYVVNTTNGTSGLGGAATLNAESYTGVDVTAAYPELIVNGVANTSMLDGIFKLTAKGPNGVAEYKFEQYKEGVFTWNNIAEEGTGIASVGMNSRYMWDGAGKYTGTATTSYVTAEDEKFAPIHAGEVARDTIGTGDDRWWRATADKPTSNTTSMGVRVFPSHTWNYFNTLYNGKVMTFDYFVADESKSLKTAYECWVAPLTYVELNGSAHTWGYGHAWVHDSFKLTENAFVALTCTNQTSSIRGGSFLTLTNHKNGNFTGPMSIYVGNFGVADGYNVEYYLEQTQEVEGVKTGLGTYSTIPNRIETFTAAVGTEVTANTALSVSTGYAYAANANEILTGTVSADGCITLKVYYKYGA